MLENTEHLRDGAGDLIKINNTRKKIRVGLFSIIGDPEDVIEAMNTYRLNQNDILK